jgi:hypothetical protein
MRILLTSSDSYGKVRNATIKFPPDAGVGEEAIILPGSTSRARPCHLIFIDKFHRCEISIAALEAKGWLTYIEEDEPWTAN